MNNTLYFVFYFRRAEEPGPGARLCSCHSVEDKNMPTLFKHNDGKRLAFMTPEKQMSSFGCVQKCFCLDFLYSVAIILGI